MRKSVLVPTAFIAGMVIASAGTATAAKLITSKDIKDGTIKAKDLSPALQKRLGGTGPQGPQGPPGPKGEPGAAGISLFTFADTAVTPAIDLSGPDVVVTSTAAQLPNATGAAGGPIEVPSGPGKYAATLTVRVQTTGAGTYTCAVQSSTNGGTYVDLDRVTADTNIMRYSIPTSAFLPDTPRTFQYRVVCNDAAGFRIVTDADLTVMVALEMI